MGSKDIMENIKKLLEEVKFKGLYIIKDGDNVTRFTSEEEGIKEDTLCQTLTISRLYYNYLAMLLFKYGKMNIYQKINTVDDRFPDYISIHDLLTHDAGINSVNTLDEFDKNKEYTLDEMIDFILIYKVKLFEKNKYGRYNYSYTNSIIFTHIIQKLIDNSIRDMMREYVIDKLELKETFFASDDIKKIWKGEILKEKEKPEAYTKIGYFYDIMATPRDIEKFITMINNELTGVFLKMFYIIHGDNELSNNLFYCISGLLYRNKGGKKGDGKTYYCIDYFRGPGSHHGISFETDNPGNRYIIMMSNTERYGEAMTTVELSRNIIIAFSSNTPFFLKPTGEASRRLTFGEIEKVVGKYANEYSMYDVKEVDGRIFLISRKQMNDLIHLGGLTFYRNYMSKIKFKENKLVVQYISGEEFEMKKVKL